MLKKKKLYDNNIIKCVTNTETLSMSNRCEILNSVSKISFVSANIYEDDPKKLEQIARNTKNEFEKIDLLGF